MIERLGPSHLQMTCEGGLRTILKIGAILAAAEADPTGSEIEILIGSSQSYRAIATIDELRDALLDEPSPYRFLRRAGV